MTQEEISLLIDRQTQRVINLNSAIAQNGHSELYKRAAKEFADHTRNLLSKYEEEAKAAPEEERTRINTELCEIEGIIAAFEYFINPQPEE